MAVGLPPIRVHDLRHSFATAALRANMNPKLVADRLGRSTVSITLNVYSDSIPEVEAAEAAREWAPSSTPRRRSTASKPRLVSDATSI